MKSETSLMFWEDVLGALRWTWKLLLGVMILLVVCVGLLVWAESGTRGASGPRATVERCVLLGAESFTQLDLVEDRPSNCFSLCVAIVIGLLGMIFYGGIIASIVARVLSRSAVK